MSTALQLEFGEIRHGLLGRPSAVRSPGGSQDAGFLGLLTGASSELTVETREHGPGGVRRLCTKVTPSPLPPGPGTEALAPCQAARA